MIENNNDNNRRCADHDLLIQVAQDVKYIKECVKDLKEADKLFVPRYVFYWTVGVIMTILGYLGFK